MDSGAIVIAIICLFILLIPTNLLSYRLGKERGQQLSNMEWKTYLLDVSNKLFLNDILYTFSRELFHKTSIYDLHKKYIIKSKEKNDSLPTNEVNNA